MTKSLFALAIAASAAALAQPVSATTFPTLTTIYIGTGVRDSGGAGNTGIVTAFHCANVSGVTATIGFLVLSASGSVLASASAAVVHGQTYTASTKGTAVYFENAILATGEVGQGAINIESTQSGVFCTAETIDGAAPTPVGVTRALVRVNPHPGTVE